MSQLDNGPAEGSRRYEVRLTGNGRHFIDLPIEDGATVLDPHGQDVRTLVRWFSRGKWVEDIHGWKLNPAHVVAVRLSR